jgi:hypothetical protein
MVHYNPEVTDNYFWSQEQFLSDSKRKNREGFAIINLYARPSGFSQKKDV